MRITSLRFRILITLALAVIVSLIIASYVVIRIQRNQLIANHLDYQHGILELARNIMVLSMGHGNPEEIQTTLDGLQEDSEIKSIKIISSEGIIRYSTEPEERGTMIARNITAGWSDTLDHEIHAEYRDSKEHTLMMVQKIENLPQCHVCHGMDKSYLGFLTIVNDVSKIDRDIAVNRNTIILSAFGTLVLVAILISLVHLRFVQRGLGQILKGIAEVERGNFQTHIHVPGTDEMGRLAASFNHMIDRLNQARHELKHLHQQQLERADKLASVGELAAGMAHEIKNPVTGISSAIKVILDDMNENEFQRPIFEEMLRQIERVDRAVNSLLSYARPQAPKFERSNINDVIIRSLKLARQHAGATKIEIKHDGDSDLPSVVIDPIQIEQVVVNLLMNAIQSMSNGGKLEVIQSLDNKSGSIVIEFRDTGVGIKPEEVKRIFKPFFTTKHKGTGLGLAICHGIIERHGGTIEVQSKVGEGSTFTLSLPLENPNGTVEIS
jgi:signal transduction histidine kinase